MKKIQFLFFATLAVAACSKDPLQGKGKNAVAGGEYEKAFIDASLPELLDENGGKTTMSRSDLQILWSEGDVIGITGATNNNVEAYIEDGFGTTSGKFSYDQSQLGGEPTYAYYPYNSDAVIEGSRLTTYLASEQTITPESVFPTNTCIMAGTASLSGAYLKSACSVVEVKLTGNDETIYKICLRSDKKPLAGTGVIDMSAATPTFVVNNNIYGDAEYQISLVLEEPVVLTSEPVSFFFTIPGGVYDDLYVVTESEDKGSFQKYSTSTHSLVAGHLQPFATMDVSHSATGATNLSAEGNSNCYIINPAAPGKYRFKAASVNGVTFDNAVSADVMWESNPGTVKNVVFNKSQNIVVFDYAGSEPGNASIALMDPDGFVQWSWHLWLCDVKDQTLPREGGDVVFCDRNLGATYTPTSYQEKISMTDAQAASVCGFYYQFGRKDPFPGPKSMDRFYENKYEGQVKSTGNPTPFDPEFSNIPTFKKCYPMYTGFYSSFEDVSRDELAGMPFAFNKVVELGDTGGNWANDVAATNYADMWGAAGEKTDNDPCPAGYRVPLHSEMMAFRNADPTDGVASTRLLYKHNQAKRLNQPDYLLFATYNAAGYYSTDILKAYYTDGAQAYPNDGQHGDNDKALVNGQFIFIPYSGVRTSGYNSSSINGYNGALSFVGHFHAISTVTTLDTGEEKMISTGGSWKSYTSALFWDNDPSADRTKLSAYGTLHDKKAEFTGDIYQHLFGMLSAMAKSGDGKYFYEASSNNMYDKHNYAHAISAALPVRCVKIQQ